MLHVTSHVHGDDGRWAPCEARGADWPSVLLSRCFHSFLRWPRAASSTRSPRQRLQTAQVTASGQARSLGCCFELSAWHHLTFSVLSTCPVVKKLQRVQARATPQSPLRQRARYNMLRWHPEWGREWHGLWRIMPCMCACSFSMTIRGKISASRRENRRSNLLLST